MKRDEWDEEEDDLPRKKRLRIESAAKRAKLGRRRKRADGGSAWKTKVDPWSARTVAPENFENSVRKSFEGKDILDRDDMTTEFNPGRKSWT